MRDEAAEHLDSPYTMLAIDDSPEALDSIRASLGPGVRTLATTNGRNGL